MDNAYLPGLDALPAEVQRYLAKPGPLEAHEARLLENYLATQGSSLPSEVAQIIGLKISSAPTDWRAEFNNLTPTPNQVGASMGMGVPSSDPAVDWMQQQPGYTAPSMSAPTLDFLERENAPGPPLRPPGLGDVLTAGLSTSPAPASLPTPPPPQTGTQDLEQDAVTPPGGPRLTPDLTAATPDQDFLRSAGAANPELSGLFTGEPGATTAGANPLPDRGGRNDRRRERGGRTNWTSEADALRADPTSVFAGLDPNFREVVANNPDVAAQILAEAQGGGAATTAAMTPRVGGALDLARLGLLQRGRDLNFAPVTASEQLETAEDWLGQASGPGQMIDPRSVYQRTLRRARRTDPMEMDIGEGGGGAGSITNQIAVTNGALAAALASSGTTREAQAGMGRRLDNAARAFIAAQATGQGEGVGMSYPEYLRKVVKAQNWLGRR